MREGGTERQVTAAEASMLQLKKRGLEGDGAAARASLAAIEEAREQLGVGESIVSTIVLAGAGCLPLALESLRMAKKLDPYRETARLVIEPWLVEAALARLPQPLSPAEQRTVIEATRIPQKVRWPEWWSEHP